MVDIFKKYETMMVQKWQRNAEKTNEAKANKDFCHRNLSFKDNLHNSKAAFKNNPEREL